MEPKPLPATSSRRKQHQAAAAAAGSVFPSVALLLPFSLLPQPKPTASMPPLPPASPPPLPPPSPLAFTAVHHHSATTASMPPEIAQKISRSEARAERSKRRGSLGVELPEHDVRRQIGCRLMNLGNSCYQNCILQILVNLPDVRERLVAFAGGHQVGREGGREGGRVCCVLDDECGEVVAIRISFCRCRLICLMCARGWSLLPEGPQVGREGGREGGRGGCCSCWSCFDLSARSLSLHRAQSNKRSLSVVQFGINAPPSLPPSLLPSLP